MPKHVTWPELAQAYHYQVVSSLERSTGRNLLSDEISALTYWNAYNSPSEKASFDNYEDFKGLMVAFRFAELPTLRDFRGEIRELLYMEGGHGELSTFKDDDDQLKNIFRFDLARRIFL